MFVKYLLAISLKLFKIKVSILLMFMKNSFVMNMNTIIVILNICDIEYMIVEDII